MKGGEERGSYRGVKGIVGGDSGKQREKRERDEWRGKGGDGREERDILPDSTLGLLFGHSGDLPHR